MRTLTFALAAAGIAQGLLPAQSLIITQQPISQTVWIGCNVTFNVGVSGVGPFSYQWQFNDNNLPNNIITTIAGGGTNDPGNDGPALNANLTEPTGVAVDASGNLFIVECSANRVRLVNTNGIITLVAGNGPAAYFGDVGPATNASLNGPQRAAVDASGNLYICDTWNGRIRKVSTNGIITTAVGGGPPSATGNGIAATNAYLEQPHDVTLDSQGNLFIVDGSRVRKVGTDGIIWTVAGVGWHSYYGDGGPATNAALQGPLGAVVDASGNIFIADSGNCRVRKVNSYGIITTVAGNGITDYSGDGGAATNASLNYPFAVAVNSWGELLIADVINSRIRKVGANGIITTVAGNGQRAFSGDGGAATNAALNLPCSVAFDPRENMFIAESAHVRKIGNTRGPTLVLNNVNLSDGGNYRVIVSGPGGSVTSTVATLTVATLPQVSRVVRREDGTVTLSLVSPPNSTNVVLTTTNLTPPVLWQTVSTNVAGANGGWQYIDTTAASRSRRFYWFVSQ